MTWVNRTDPATWTVDTLVNLVKVGDLRYNEVKKFALARSKALNNDGGDSAQMMVRFQKEIDLVIQHTPLELQTGVHAEVREAMDLIKQQLAVQSDVAKVATQRNKTLADQVKVTTSNAKLRQATLMNDDALKEVQALAERLLAKRKRDAEQQETKRAKHEATESLAKEQTRMAELKKEIQVEKNRTLFGRAQDAIKNATEWAERKVADLLARDEDPAEEGDGSAGDGAACPPPGAAGPGGPA
jgi:hypothetical protein